MNRGLCIAVSDALIPPSSGPAAQWVRRRRGTEQAREVAVHRASRAHARVGRGPWIPQRLPPASPRPCELIVVTEPITLVLLLRDDHN